MKCNLYIVSDKDGFCYLTKAPSEYEGCNAVAHELSRDVEDYSAEVVFESDNKIEFVPISLDLNDACIKATANNEHSFN